MKKAEYIEVDGGRERDLRVDGRYIGKVRFTRGGFWRAWSAGGHGLGPFDSEAAAEAWVRKAWVNAVIPVARGR